MMTEVNGSDVKQGKGDECLPPHYDNLNFDVESENLPSAPDDGGDSEFQGTAELLAAPTAPPYVPSYEPRTLTYNPPLLVYEEIYEACIRYVKAHCCYSSRFVRQMTLTEIKNECAFHYVLETFCEKRESCPASTPYIGQYIDGPENGPPPAPWDIPVHPPALFQDGAVKAEIPHTAVVKPCDVCVGNGRVRCNSCSGRGRSMCFSCCGSGRRTVNGQRSTCISCSGSGYKRCYKCSGTGQVKCKKCNGHKNLKCYRMLIVTWNNFSEDFFANTHNLPSALVRTVTGNKMLFEEEQMLAPIVNAPDMSVNEGSRRLIERHRVAFQNMHTLKQRHVLRAIPLTKVFYQWRDKDGEFYVYGQEKKVYFQDYPQKCCCCTCL